MTSGWYWLDEVRAAARASLGMEYQVKEWVHYDPCPCPPPLADVSRLYDLRHALGKNSPEGRAIKLLINSIYGKFAQSVGDPKFQNAVYASLITSGCRTMILDAIGSHPDGAHAVAMVATDGVYFRTPHPTLPVSPTTLGQWDHTVRANTCLFMPGMYWDDKAREAVANDEAIAFKARGVNARFLAPHLDRIDREFSSGFDERHWPEVTIPIPFAMVTPKQALARKKWHLAGTVSSTGTRTLSSHPGSKRIPVPMRDDDVIRTAVYGGVSDPSTPHTRGMVYGDPGEPVDIDGRALQSALAEWIHG